MSGLEWDIGTVTLSEFEGGFLGIQVEMLGKGATSPTLQLHQPYGFFSRPRDPEVNEEGGATLGCGALYSWEEDDGHVMLGGDPRAIVQLPRIAKGSAGQYALRDDGKVSFSVLDAQDGSWMLYLPAADGRATQIKASHADGFDLASPHGRIRCGPLGIHLDHSSGAEISIGSIGGLPAPLDTLASYVTIRAAMLNLEASIVNIGTDGGATSQAALAGLSLLLLAMLDAITLITPATAGAAALSSVGLTPVTIAALHAIPAPTGLKALLAPIGRIV